MRANGTRTPKELRTELARIEREILAVQASEKLFRETFKVPVLASVGDAWNALHDAERALREEFRAVELNRSHVVSALAIMVSENRD